MARWFLLRSSRGIRACDYCTGEALGITEVGGGEPHAQTQAAITEALRLALLAEGYDALAADTLSQAAGVGLAQVVGSAVGEAKAGPGITYGRRYYIGDHLGSVRVVVTTSGTVVEARDYYAYGLMMPGRVYVQGIETREGFTGYEHDAETGHYYAGARYYMPALGRFTSTDRFHEMYPSLSPYQYAGNSPAGVIDVNGDSLWVNFTQDGANHQLYYENSSFYPLYTTKRGKPLRDRTWQDG